MARISSLEEMYEAVDTGIAFLLAGTVYSDVPYAKVDSIRTKNRRLGLGLMGMHEWMLDRGLKYGPSEELEKYMQVYAKSTEMAADWADKWELSRPIKTRAMAPNGTIGIVGETSTCLEPVFCVAYKRRYLKGHVWNYQYVIDPTAKRLIDAGVNPDSIEDAYTLAEDVERRVAFQAWVQQFVDHGISSTINLPSWGSEHNNEHTVQDFGRMLIKHLPHLRGITCYPDGARGGQPLTPVSYRTAIRHVGEVFVEQADVCDITKAGSCGA
jgi:ribonucleoside-diphosphate reductase alpha chain